LDSATSALDYKLSHPHSKPAKLPTIEPPRWSAEEAVSNILYNTPPPSQQPFVRHTLNCLVQNEPGVLARVSGTLAARGFNIESLVVCATEIKDLSRMNIVLRGQESVIEQARRQLEDLVPVWAVLNYTNTKSVSRELLLCKVSILGPDYFETQLSRRYDWETSASPVHPEDGHLDENSPVAMKVAERVAEAAAKANPYAHLDTSDVEAHQAHHHHGHVMTASEALNQKNGHLASIELLSRQFGGKISDVSNDCCIIEISGNANKIDAFLKLVRPYGILEMARSGLMVIPRGWARSATDEEDEEIAQEVEVVDSSLLPPG